MKIIFEVQHLERRSCQKAAAYINLNNPCCSSSTLGVYGRFTRELIDYRQSHFVITDSELTRTLTFTSWLKLDSSVIRLQMHSTQLDEGRLSQYLEGREFTLK